jgi:hypothetical protein
VLLDSYALDELQDSVGFPEVGGLDELDVSYGLNGSLIWISGGLGKRISFAFPDLGGPDQLEGSFEYPEVEYCPDDGDEDVSDVELYKQNWGSDRDKDHFNPHAKELEIYKWSPKEIYHPLRYKKKLENRSLVSISQTKLEAQITMENSFTVIGGANWEQKFSSSPLISFCRWRFTYNNTLV